MTTEGPIRSAGRNALRVAVFGAGAFGGWTAYALARGGARVTLFDAWGPGHARASSGGETRVIRATYGSHSVYTAMAARALDLWRAHEARWQRRLIRHIGALWMFGSPGDARFVAASGEALAAHGLALDRLTSSEAARRFPQVSFDGILEILFEPQAGYLLARRACEHVVECLMAEGGEYRLGAAESPVRVEGSSVRAVRLVTGEMVEADCFVFACGPWLGSLFPETLGNLLSVTRQEVFYFGTPAGDDRFTDERMPVWIDFRDRVMYGVPGNAHRGFKIADDTTGPIFDPTSGDRDASAAGIAAARAFVADRFPALSNAPLVGSEVCQYESTPDSNYIIDRHPEAANLWIAGGGSGHGYKMGPAIGEMISSLVLDGGQPPPLFALERFAAPPVGGWKQKWS
jgi:glycine/D-amino acid oxidase-like deaminating enzyme